MAEQIGRQEGGLQVFPFPKGGPLPEATRNFFELMHLRAGTLIEETVFDRHRDTEFLQDSELEEVLNTLFADNSSAKEAIEKYLQDKNPEQTAAIEKTIAVLTLRKLREVNLEMKTAFSNVDLDSIEKEAVKELIILAENARNVLDVLYKIRNCFFNNKRGLTNEILANLHHDLANAYANILGVLDRYIDGRIETLQDLQSKDYDFLVNYNLSNLLQRRGWEGTETNVCYQLHQIGLTPDKALCVIETTLSLLGEEVERGAFDIRVLENMVQLAADRGDYKVVTTDKEKDNQKGAIVLDIDEKAVSKLKAVNSYELAYVVYQQLKNAILIHLQKASAEVDRKRTVGEIAINESRRQIFEEFKVCIKLKISLEQDGSIGILVSDNGIGTSYDELKKTFLEEARDKLETGRASLLDILLIEIEKDSLLRNHLPHSFLNQMLLNRGASLKSAKDLGHKGTGIGLSSLNGIAEGNHGFPTISASHNEGFAVGMRLLPEGEDGNLYRAKVKAFNTACRGLEERVNKVLKGSCYDEASQTWHDVYELTDEEKAMLVEELVRKIIADLKSEYLDSASKVESAAA